MKLKEFKNTDGDKISKKYDDNCFPIPSGESMHNVTEILNAGQNATKIDDWNTNKSRIIDYTQAISEIDNKSIAGTWDIQKKTTHIVVRIEDINKILGTKNSAPKLFIAFLLFINERAQTTDTGDIFFEFSTTDLVQMGIYSSLQSARQGLQTQFPLLTNLKITAKLRNSDNIEIGDALRTMFPSVDKMKNGVYRVYLNNQIKWDDTLTYYMLLPPIYFSMANNAANLLLYIFSIANVKRKEIAKTGKFIISLKALHSRLHLPFNSTNPRRDMLQPIIKAMNEIVDNFKRNYPNDLNFRITPKFSENAPVYEIIENGVYEISFMASYLNFYKKIAKLKPKKNPNKKKPIA